MSAPCPSRDYFPAKRLAPATPPQSDALTFAQAVQAAIFSPQNPPNRNEVTP